MIPIEAYMSPDPIARIHTVPNEYIPPLSNWIPCTKLTSFRHNALAIYQSPTVSVADNRKVRDGLYKLVTLE